jgi:integrase
MDAVAQRQIATRSTGTGDQKKAEAIAQEWLANGLPEDQNAVMFAKTTSFCDFLHNFWDFKTSDYFKELKAMGKEPHLDHSVEMQRCVARYYRGYFKTKLLIQIDEETLQKFIVHLKVDEGYAASTVNSVRNCAFVALRYAKRKKIITRFDFDAVLRAGGKSAKRGILEKEEVEKLFNLEWRDPRSRMAALIASQTGLRMGEIRALRVCDIQEDKINVEHSFSHKSGMKSTKNREARQVPILPGLHTEIVSYIKTMGLFNLDGFLFPGNVPGKPYCSKQMGKDFNRMLAKIGIGNDQRKEMGIVFHSWRHFMAKNLAQVTNRTIGMKILGHKTGAMFDHYADHVDKETFAKMTEAIKQGIKSGEEINLPIPFPQASGK